MFFCLEGYSASIINGGTVNGMFRGSVQTKTNLVGSRFTNSLIFDYVLVNMPLRTYVAGWYQTYASRPKYMTNWKFICPSLATNVVSMLPISAFRLTNVAMSAMTNALHPIVVTEATQKAQTLARTYDKTITNILHPIVVTESTQKARITAQVFDVISSNVFHLNITNVLSPSRTNRLRVRSLDATMSNFYLYVSNYQVKVRTK